MNKIPFSLKMLLAYVLLEHPSFMFSCSGYYPLRNSDFAWQLTDRAVWTTREERLFQ